MNRNNEKFIEWALDYIDDDERLKELKLEALSRLSEFFDLPKDQLAQQLKQKLIRGSQEHDITKCPVETVEKEINEEHLDLLGWPLVAIYLKAGDLHGE